MTSQPTAAATAAPPAAIPGALSNLLTSCFTGAAIDSLFKQVFTVALVAVAWKTFANDSAQAELASANYSAWAMVLFMAPFIILAPLAGSLGDRLPKHLVIRAARLADIPICALGVWGFDTGSPLLMFTALTGLATASAFFAPVKLAVLPELVGPQQLARANAGLAATTVAAILIGTCLSACTDHDLLVKRAPELGLRGFPIEHLPATVLAMLGALLCSVGIASAFRVPRLVAQAPDRRLAMPWSLGDQLRALSQTKGLWAPALALGGFWALGGAAMVGIAPLVKAVYHQEQAGTVGPFLALVAGIVTGSVLAPRYLARAYPAGLPAFGALLAGGAFAMAGWHALGDAALPLAERSRGPLALWLLLSGIGAGLWEVPLTVLLQERAPAGSRNLVMSGVGVIGSIGTALAAGIYAMLSHAGTLTGGAVANLNSAQVFLALGLFSTALAVVITSFYRHQFAGWMVSVALKLAYQVRVIGAANLPASGGCLVVCNHLSYADGVIMAVSLPRPGRFLVYRAYVEMPVVGFFMRVAGVIPVAAEDARRALLAAIDTAVEAAKAGEVVVIFPEGKLTRSGQTDVFRSGLERIAGRAGVPVIPAHLHGLWGTITSRATKRSWPRPLRPVELRIGAPLPAETVAASARDQVMRLGYESAQVRANRDRGTLGASVIGAAKRHPLRTAVHDAGGTLGNLMLAALARALLPRLGLAKDEGTVGLLLPPGRAGTIANVALALGGRTAVNLNHTVGPAQLARMCELSGVRTVISAGLYLRKLGIKELPGRTVLIEELLPAIGKPRLAAAVLAMLLLPRRLLDHGRPDQVAAIIFSSGSTGDPKGVELTHRQLLANCRCTAIGLDVHGGRDVVLSPLPLFHSFGLVPGMWLGLTTGFTVAAQPDPTDGKALGELAQACGATFLISTPTFVRGYLRRIEPAQLKMLRFAVVGAERCPPDLKATFKERYGADLLEGYGCTELAPVVAVNLPNVARDGVNEIRSKDGSVGRALPGLHAFTVDPESKAILPPGAEGLIVIRSPSRMRGYLNRPDLDEQAFIHGGYNTGDIGRVDGDGFICITGRLARFAKIGGEMVPLDNVEAALQGAIAAVLSAPTEGQAEVTIEIAVAAVADEGRGERLVVMHTGFSGSWDEVLKALDAHPPLWRPKPKDIKQVEAIPKLGTGKRDLAGIKKLAAASTAVAPAGGP